MTIAVNAQGTVFKGRLVQDDDATAVLNRDAIAALVAEADNDATAEIRPGGESRQITRHPALTARPPAAKATPARVAPPYMVARTADDQHWYTAAICSLYLCLAELQTEHREGRRMAELGPETGEWTMRPMYDEYRRMVAVTVIVSVTDPLVLQAVWDLHPVDCSLVKVEPPANGKQTFNWLHRSLIDKN